MPKLDGILETAIHTEDMARSRAFYEGVLGLEVIYSDNRLSCCGRTQCPFSLSQGHHQADRYAAQRHYSRPRRRWHAARSVRHPQEELDRWEEHLAS